MGIGKEPAHIGRVSECLRRQERHVVAGEESNVQRATLNVGHHPLRHFGTTEGVLMEEPFVCRNIQPVETPGTGHIHVDIERRGRFSRSELLDGSQRKPDEVDGQPCFGNGDVTCDLVCIGTRRSPIAPILRGKGERADEKDSCERDSNRSVHASSMTSAGRAGQTRGCAARDPWTFREG